MKKHKSKLQKSQKMKSEMFSILKLIELKCPFRESHMCVCVFVCVMHSKE